jgi:hypothetical protein
MYGMLRRVKITAEPFLVVAAHPKARRIVSYRTVFVSRRDPI